MPDFKKAKTECIQKMRHDQAKEIPHNFFVLKQYNFAQNKKIKILLIL